VKRSLSLYLSFAQDSCAYLSAQVAMALEILADLDTNFELVLVDRTGNEETTELAMALAATYPQVRVAEASWADMPFPARKGQRPSGHVVLVAESSAGLRAGDLHEQFQAARVSAPARPWPRWSQRVEFAH
jgi:hypothetical protein